MKMPVVFLLMLFFILPMASADQEIKQFTISDYLQIEKTKADKQGRKANRLIYETSPYLLQHAYNPVDWYTWGPEAFEKAKKENKPIFLSIGYSTCHWCHVMAHESFENEKIASLLNKYFVCIKVDREQRPDIDAVYMSATQLVNGHGGWPMSVFLDNQLRPFHAATYYPPFATASGDGLNEVLLKIQSLWSTQPDLINQVASNITERITAIADETTEASSLLANIDDLAMRQITNSFDTEWGGFSVAPKFPRPGIFSYLNRLAVNQVASNQQSLPPTDRQFGSLKMMEATLDAMAAGGIYDHVAGGFHRYSVDESWQVPHFEKMLYSQALMVMAYSDYYRTNPKESYKNIVFETLNFVEQEMRSSENGFYSALDADSERADKPGVHAEGAYYLWSESELKNTLSRDELEFVKDYFNVDSEGNIYSDPQQEFTSLNILYIAEQFRGKVLSVKQKKTLSLIKRKLNAKRYFRPRPHLDDKIITAWNGMMLAAYARASMVFQQPDFLQSAIQSLSFIKENLYDKESKKLFRQYRIDKSSSEAMLSDYVWLIYGLLEVYQANGDKQKLVWAKILQAKQNVLFLDKKTGAYYESTANDSNVLFRSKSIFDGALPSANAIALANLRRLSRFVDKEEQKEFASQANDLVGSFASVINKNPAAASMLLSVEVFDAKK